MPNDTVTHFYDKNASEGYGATYDLQHGDRLDKTVDHFNLSKLTTEKVLDIGGGLGFLGKRLPSTIDYWVIDGAETRPEQRVAKGQYLNFDLDHSHFGSYRDTAFNGFFDVAFILETIEHCGNPHHVLVETKKLVREGGMILVSIPTITVWHNAPYPGLLWPTEHFEQFLGQMALPVVNRWDYIPGPGKGWPAHHFLCTNRPWSEKRLMFPKAEAKFRDCTPLEATNL